MFCEAQSAGAEEPEEPVHRVLLAAECAFDVEIAGAAAGRIVRLGHCRNPLAELRADPRVRDRQRDQENSERGQVELGIHVAPADHHAADEEKDRADRVLPARIHGLGVHHGVAELLEDHDDERQDDADRAGVAHLLVEERLPDHEQRGDGGLAAGAAGDAREREDHARVLDRVDDHEHEEQVDRAHDQRQLDLRELRPPRHAVDFRGLVDVLGDALQFREVREDGERADPRKAPDDARRDDQLRVAQPRGHLPGGKRAPVKDVRVEIAQDVEQAALDQELVEVAGGRLEEERAPDQDDDEAGDDHRDDEQRAVQELHALAPAAVDRDSDQQGRDHLDHVPAAEDERELERVPELGVLQQVDVVLEADRLRNVRAVPAEEAVVDPAARGVVLEQRDQDDRRDDEEIDLPVVADLAQFDGFRGHGVFTSSSSSSSYSSSAVLFRVRRRDRGRGRFSSSSSPSPSS